MSFTLHALSGQVQGLPKDAMMVNSQQTHLHDKLCILTI
jgi:hypothetical protein